MKIIIEQPENLTDAASNLLALAVTLRNSSDFGNPEDLRQKVINLFTIFESTVQKVPDIDPEDVVEAKYALSALLDSIILNSEWHGKETWGSEPLEILFFNKNIAGSEFFNKLDLLMPQIKKKRHLAEIYYFCLILGFEGKFQIEGLDKLKTLTYTFGQDLNKLVSDKMPVLSRKSDLPRELIPNMKNTEMPYWVPGIGFISIVFLVFVILQVLIKGEVSKTAEILQRVISGAL